MQNMAKNIVIVGGYGHVGQMIAKQLIKYFAGRIVIAGRSAQKAAQIAAQFGGDVQPLQLDVTQLPHSNFLATTALVVMCIDQENPVFAEACMAHGIHYVDISANYTVLKKLSTKQTTGTAILSVGLAPGITNLLAKEVHRLLHGAQQIDISIMLGLGDQHGDAAIDWTLQSLIQPFMLRGEYVQPLTQGKTIDFQSLGTHQAYRFNFSDQHILSETLQVPVDTRFCVEVPVAMQAFRISQKIGVVKALQHAKVRKMMLALLRTPVVGKEIFAVKVEANKDGKRAQALLIGHQEALITAQMAAAVVQKVMMTSLPQGIYHIDQLFDWTDFESLLTGVTFQS